MKWQHYVVTPVWMAGVSPQAPASRFAAVSRVAANPAVAAAAIGSFRGAAGAFETQAEMW
jgi:hypothetical protein